MANENEVSISNEFPEGIPNYPTSHPNWAAKEVENPASEPVQENDEEEYEEPEDEDDED